MNCEKGFVLIMNNVRYLTLADAVNADKQTFNAVLRDALCYAVSNLSEEELKNTFFPEHTAGTFSLGIEIQKVA